MATDHPSTVALRGVRSATLSDLDRLVAIEEASFLADRISRRSFRAFVDRASAGILVLEAPFGTRQTGVVAYALILFRKGSTLARLYSIAVDPDAEGRGHGSTLLQACERAAMARGRVRLRLEVREDNGRAIAMYENQRYRLIGRALGYYADGAAALRFEKALGDNPSPASRKPGPGGETPNDTATVDPRGR